MNAEVRALRRRLGIPDEAERVILFTESSHWDPDWLKTSERYYSRYVEHNLEQALEALYREPRRVYSVECLFFLRMYWERQPHRRETVRRLVNEGRLRLTGSGVTTADTLLPSAEAILRDMLIGQEWLRANGMEPEPRLAYFTDSFGCSPALPSLLRAAGFDRTAITRMDGMYFAGADYEPAGRFPRPGSSAAHLLKGERTLDFVWRDRNGAEVLCHWNAYTYGQGDMLAHRGATRIYIFPFAFPERSERHVARQIDGYARQLAPLSRTPYLLCPIGFDFVPPIRDLVGLLDRYNRVRYPSTGVWAVNGGLDDYLALVECRRDALPVVELDPNPYWTGFYTARPALKKRCYDLVDGLLLAERLSLLPKCREIGSSVQESLAPAWWNAAVSNHHDFVTGTSPNRIADGEQSAWLEQAARVVNQAIEKMKPLLPVAPHAAAAPVRLPRWSRDGDLVRVETSHYVFEMSEAAGGCIVRATSADGRRSWLSGLSNDLVSYRDSGGLWRMGHEFRGGALTAVDRSSRRRGALDIRERGDCLEVSCTAVLDGETIERRLWFRSDSPVVCGGVYGRAARRRTVTLSFAPRLATGTVTMGQPGGAVSRPTRKLYDPTFWPVQAFAHLQDTGEGHGLAFCLSAPGALASRQEGEVELVVLRNATLERAYGLVPFPAHPAAGYEKEACAFEYGFLFSEQGDWRENRLPALAQRLADLLPDAHGRAGLKALVASQVVIETPDGTEPEVFVAACKRASRGEGLIVRLETAAPPQSISVRLPGHSIAAAFLCDARERDVGALPVRDGVVPLIMTGSIATVRFLSPAGNASAIGA